MPETSNSYDFSHLRCPLLLVKIKQLIVRGSSGDQWIFKISDARLYADLAKLTTKLHFTVSREAISDDEWQLVIERLPFEQGNGIS